MNKLLKGSASRTASIVVGLLLCFFLLAAGITRSVPKGGMEGRITMLENGKPIPNIQVTLRERDPYDWQTYQRLPAEKRPQTYVEWTDAEGKFRFSNVKAGDYEVSATAEAHEIRPIWTNIAEGKPKQLDLEMKPVAPYLRLYSNQHVFQSDEAVELQLHGFVEDNSVTFKVSKLHIDRIDPSAEFYRAFQPLDSGATAKEARGRLLGETVATVEKPADQRTPEGTFQQFFALPKLPVGDYWVECTSAGLSQGTWINVTKIALVTKSWPSGTLSYVADIVTGEPIEGASIYAPQGKTLQYIGKTSKNGTHQAPRKNGQSDQIFLARFEGSTALTGSYVYDEAASATQVALVTDRPIYRPGDEVQFKGIVRRRAGTDYKLPTAKQIEIEIRDSSETLIRKETRLLSASGTFSGAFSTSKEAEPGLYGIRTNIDGEKSTEWVRIAAYRKPEYKITVKPEKEHYVRGDKIRFLIQAEYYYGSPVAGAKIDASASRNPLWTWQGVDEEDQYEYESYEYGYSRHDAGDDWFQEFEAVTDADGKAVIEIDTSDPDHWGPQTWDDPALSTIDLWVGVNDGDRFASSSGSAEVSQGQIKLSVNTGSYIADIGKPITVSLSAMQLDGKTAVSGARVSVVTGYEIYTGREVVFKAQDKLFVTTGSDGKAVLQVTPQHGGSFVLRAEVADSRNNRVLASDYLWVYGGASSDIQPPQKGLTLELDKRSYSVGDTARALVMTDKPGGFALLTVEGDRVHSARIVPLRDKVNEVSIPVEDGFKPNAFISVCNIENKRFHETSRRLKVSLAGKTVQVQITPDKAEYAPGSTAQYTVRTFDRFGKPTPAEVSLGVVDESIYALAPDSTDLLRTFYPAQYNRVRTNYSFEEIYLDGGDKAPSDIQVRSVFKDTAYWNPAIETGPGGMAKVAVALPDNLTTWRATAVAITDATDVGMAVAKVRAKKDLMVRLQTPSYLVQGDNQQLLAMVTNDTTRDVNVNVQLEQPPVPIQGDLRQNVRIPAGATRPVEWLVTAPEPGFKTLTVRAWVDGGASDGERKTFQVQPHGRVAIENIAGEIGESTTVRMNVHEGADPNSGYLTVTVSPTLASALVQSLDELIGFPYGCVEQTMSRLLPAVLVSQALQEAKIPPPPLASQIPAIARDGFTRLKALRHYDGGWGWWEQDESDLYMTSLVLEGLYRAKAAGFPAVGIDPSGALDWMAKSATSPLPTAKDWRYNDDLSSRLAAAYVLALYGKQKKALETLARLPLQQLGPYETAMLSLTYGALGKGHESLQKQALDLMIGQRVETQGMASWPERYWGSETTARCLLALASANPRHPLIPKVVRHLMMIRRAGVWTSTRDTSHIVVALTAWWRATGGVANSGTLTIGLNGKLLKTVPITPASATSPDLAIQIPMSELRPGENRIEFQRSGGGVCFYSAELRQTVIQKELGPTVSGPGLTIERNLRKMEPVRMENGLYQTVASARTVSLVERGDILECQMSVANEKDLQFVMIEVPIPSNCDITEREVVDEYGEWAYEYDSFVKRDDRASLFIRTLEKGIHTFSFKMRANKPGKSSALPAVLYNMYDPGVRSSSAESPLEVRGR